MSSIALRTFDNTADDPQRRSPLVLGDQNLGSITETVCEIVERPRPPAIWYVLLTISGLLVLNLGAMVTYLIVTGVGVWGNTNPVGWAWDITNFVFWIGIGHAGTLISAILFLFRQGWRTSINRAAEAMTLFAVMCAGLYPGIHVGRVWVVYWMFPIPNQMQMWPQFRSPLMWDIFAISTYLTVSLLFWYTGLVPDLATLRDRSTSPIARRVFGFFALGWRGSARQWHRYERAYLLLAALSTPLVLSVHSVVSFDFATSQLPGWHTTIFPPYFVAGAIFGGFAMVVLLLVPVRSIFHLKHLITLRHLENMNKIIMATGMMVGYAYATEFFIAWYSGNTYELFTFFNRALGPYAWAYWAMIFCNVVSPQIFWFAWARRSIPVMYVVSILVTIGMWFERFVIIVSSLSRDFLPAAWYYYRPTYVDICTFAGTCGLFVFMFLLFCRFLPVIAIAEVKQVLPHDHDVAGHKISGNGAPADAIVGHAAPAH
ncbi:MAG: polysulfide reductase NrfD [Pirellulales bacterium]|nr:polysulfide reductase NrfD [Pirellulales bacterium]